MRTVRYASGGPPGLPQLAPWMKRLLGGLLALFVVELVLTAAGVDVGALVWRPIGEGFAPWQLLTRFLVQGAGNVLGVALSLLVLYFLLPAAEQMLTRRQLVEALVAAAVIGTLLPLAWDLLRAAGVLPGWGDAVHGWAVFSVALICLFGLAQPGATVHLYFVLPVRASWFVWGSLAFALLYLLSALATGGGVLGPLQHVGVWAGTFGWWHLRGPGGRRRTLKRKARDIERELSRFRVLPGGRDEGFH